MARFTKKKPAQVDRAFMVMEATSFVGGGFPAYLHELMESMTTELNDAGYLAPYTFKFSGGDGVTVPVLIHATIG